MGGLSSQPEPALLTAPPLQTTQQEMEKLKAQYRSLVRDSTQAKRKYQEASKGGCQPHPRAPPAVHCYSPYRLPLSSTSVSGTSRPPAALWDAWHSPGDAAGAAVLRGGCLPRHLPADKERERAKEKYVRSLWKLYALHNQYVLAVRAAALHHHHHYQRALPTLHESLYSLQQEMVLVL